MDMAEKKEHMVTTGQWPLSAYRWKTERFLDRYVQGLKERKLLGLRCADCGTIYVPPMPICARCHSKLRLERDEDWLPVSQQGTVITYTVTYTDVAPGGLRVLSPEERRIFVLVQPDAVDTHILLELKESNEEEVHVGMRVQAVFAEETKGVLADLAYFKPVR
jgi:hypothetical protein